MDGLLKLIDRIIDLLRERERNQEMLFEKIIEPLFRDTEIVVQQYFNFFYHAKSLLSAEPSVATKDIVETLRSKRHEHLQLRLKLTEMAYTIRNEIPDRNVGRFIDNVLRVFSATSHNSHEGYQSARKFLIDLLDMPESFIVNKSGRGFLHIWIDKTLRETEQAYVALAQSYASLRIKCLIPHQIKLSKGNPFDRGKEI